MKETGVSKLVDRASDKKKGEKVEYYSLKMGIHKKNGTQWSEKFQIQISYRRLKMAVSLN